MDVFQAIRKHGKNVHQMIHVSADGLVIPALFIVLDLIQAADANLARIVMRKIIV